MKKDERSISFRIDEDMRRKLAYISKYEGRSINGQLLYMVRALVRRFEEKNGPIVFEDSEDNL